MFSLAGKAAFVTGAGSGIGAAIAQCFAAAGARVWVADINRQTGEAVTQQIAAAGGQARFVEVNVADEASCAHAAAAMLHHSGGACDVLVNNAGIGCVGTMLTTTPADLDRLYAVNVKGVLHVTRAFLPGMIQRGRGAIINMASVAGIVAVRDRLAYCATKFAVVGITKCTALDHATTGVRVNCICPGRVETPWVQARIKEYPDPRKAYAEMAATQPVGRMARAEEVAAAALYLASDEAAMVTGSCVMVDGGWSAGR